jgi:UDP-N-acetylmuramoyl-tripeptide--D-alanyl-D-alanine ligase
MKIDVLYEHLKKCNHQVSTDTRKITIGSIFFALKGKNFDGNDYALEALKNGAAYCVVDNESVSKLDQRIFLVDNVLETIQKLSTYNREKSKCCVIALTGSNGKTTTKELMYHILKTKYEVVCTSGNLNNHIGVPLSLLQIKESTEFAVIEMGANNFGEIEFLTNLVKPNMGYITNFGLAHLEGFIDLKGVIKGKTELYNWLIENRRKILINNDDVEQKKFINENTVLFGKNDNSNYQFEHIISDHISLKINDVIIETQLYGSYNFSNVCAAITLGLENKIELKEISKSLKNYSSENNRSQIISKNNSEIIMDAYNANPTSVKHALKSLSELNSSKIAIIGDMFELGKTEIIEHDKIVKYALDLNIDKIIFIGSRFKKCEVNFKNFYFFNNKTELLNSNLKLNEKYILIKGSRSMRMETILNELQ